MREVCKTAQPKHVKGFEFRELGLVERGKRGETSRWDWEIYPLTGPTGSVTHLLNVILDVSEPNPRKSGPSKETRQADNRRREEASGVLRIFGLAPDTRADPGGEKPSGREHQAAERLARGQSKSHGAHHVEART